MQESLLHLGDALGEALRVATWSYSRRSSLLEVLSYYYSLFLIFNFLLKLEQKKPRHGTLHWKRTFSSRKKCLILICALWCVIWLRIDWKARPVEAFSLGWGEFFFWTLYVLTTFNSGRRHILAGPNSKNYSSWLCTSIFRLARLAFSGFNLYIVIKTNILYILVVAHRVWRKVWRRRRKLSMNWIMLYLNIILRTFNLLYI